MAKIYFKKYIKALINNNTCIMNSLFLSFDHVKFSFREWIIRFDITAHKTSSGFE